MAHTPNISVRWLRVGGIDGKAHFFFLTANTENTTYHLIREHGIKKKKWIRHIWGVICGLAQTSQR